VHAVGGRAGGRPLCLAHYCPRNESKFPRSPLMATPSAEQHDQDRLSGNDRRPTLPQHFRKTRWLFCSLLLGLFQQLPLLFGELRDLGLNRLDVSGVVGFLLIWWLLYELFGVRNLVP